VKRQFDLSSLVGSLVGNGGSSGGGLSGILQSVGGIATSMSNMLLKSISIKATTIKELQPEVRPNAKRIQMKYGPFKIKGRQSNV
jgi:hypothetical protein